MNGTEILFLYDEIIDASGIRFIPVATCDTVYCVDNFDRNKYIKADCIFSKAHEERLAELEHIAYCLGAKSCSVEIIELRQEESESSKKIGVGVSKKAFSSNEHYEGSSSHTNTSQLNGKTVTNFEGSNNPERPTLKWFAHDEGIKNLIEMRCTANNSIKSRQLELSGSSSATMSEETACTIDAVIFKAKNKNAISMETQATREHSRKLIYTVEF